MIGDVAAETTFTIYDLHDTDVPRSPRELPRLVLAALRIVWSAGRRQAAIAIALQVVGGLGTAALVLLGKHVLDGLLAADRTGGGIEDFLPRTLSVMSAPYYCCRTMLLMRPSTMVTTMAGFAPRSSRSSPSRRSRSRGCGRSRCRRSR